MKSLLRSKSAEVSMDIRNIITKELLDCGVHILISQSHHTKLLYVWRWSRFLGLLKLQIITTQLKTLSPTELSIGMCSKQSKTKILNGRNNV
jgi:hypothetical protein